MSRPGYLNDFPGYEYKESSGGGDYSDSRGGIKYAWNWGSVGLVKDNVVWGDNYHGSNILSGRAPSFPMLTLHLKTYQMNLKCSIFTAGWCLMLPIRVISILKMVPRYITVRLISSSCGQYIHVYSG